MGWYSRKVLRRKLFNTMGTDFCMSALGEALARYGTPDIFKTDQGSQFSCAPFAMALRDHGVRVSVGSRGRWLDNVFIRHLCRSLKYERVYLHAFETSVHACEGIGKWVDFYNQHRPHSRLGAYPLTGALKKILKRPH